MPTEVEAEANVLHLSLVIGSAVTDASGTRIGRVKDLVADLTPDRPLVNALLVRRARGEGFVAAGAIAQLEYGRVGISTTKLAHYEARSGQVFLRKDVLDRRVIDVDSGRLVRVNEIELARVDGHYEVVGVDGSLRGLLRRLVPRRLAESFEPSSFTAWESIEPFASASNPEAAHPKLDRLHPAQLADLVEELGLPEGEELVDVLGRDLDRQARLLAEIRGPRRREVLREHDDATVAQLLAELESDDAADLIAELPEERREPVLELLPPVQERRGRTLLGYDPATAGGLMDLSYLCLYRDVTQAQALERLRSSRAPGELLTCVYVMNENQRLRGVIPIIDLLRADPSTPLAELARAIPVRVRTDADLEEIARLMTDYDLTALPVVDARERMIGVIAVDDVLELLLPNRWRRRFTLFEG